MINYNYGKSLQLIAAVVVFGATYLFYQSGIAGGFLFDDFPNLEELGAFGEIDNWESFKSFVFNGFSGPTGRPLSLASFLIDDNTWPSNASWFKATNVKIHLINGLLLFWVTINLLRTIGYDESKAVSIGIIGAGIWVLHPYFVSTTLYVVQRMALLSATFSLLGFLGYLHGRQLFNRGNLSAAYVWMSTSATLGTFLAVLSKENGILLPFLIGIFEFCFKGRLIKHDRRWVALFLVLPIAIIITYLLSKLSISPESMPGRQFSQLERLMTQGRVLWEYLFDIYVPKIEGRGLFHDGYSVSRSLFDQHHTWLYCASILGLIYIAVIFRKGNPQIFSFPILWFFGAHIIESTWLNLELYFEHRNYLASFFLFLPVGFGMVWLRDRHGFKGYVLAIIAIFGVLAFLLDKRVSLWGDNNKLEMYWAASTPESPRAQNRLGVLLLEQGRFDESIAFFDEMDQKFTTSSLITINGLLVKVWLNRATEQDFVRAKEKLKIQPFDAQSVKGLRNLVDRLREAPGNPEYSKWTLELLDGVKMNRNYKDQALFVRLFYYLRGRLYLNLKDDTAALENFSQALEIYNDIDASLSMVAELGNSGFPDSAILLLNKSEKMFKLQTAATLKRSAHIYIHEIDSMRKELNKHSRYLMEHSNLSKGYEH